MDPLDPFSLATAAAAAVGGYLVRFLSGVTERAADVATDRLVRVVSERLQASRTGRDALLHLQESPAESRHRDGVAQALAGEIEQDPAFGMTLAKLLNIKSDVTTTGDGNVVNTGSWENRRGVVATGRSRIDQSKHVTINSGAWVWVLVVVVLVLGGGTTAAVVMENSGPAYPELEGSWSGRDGDDGTRMAMHIVDEQFTFEALGARGEQMRCSGTVSRGEEEAYSFSTTEGVCGRIMVTIKPDGSKLICEFDTAGRHYLKRD